MAYDVPIRVSVESLVEFLNKDGAEITADKVQAIAAANPAIFTVEDRQGVETLVTTRSGRAPIDPVPDTHHRFAQRLMTPLPKPEVPAAPPRERAQVDVGWRGIDRLLPDLDDLDVAEDEADVEAESPILSATIVPEPEAATVEEEAETETEAPLSVRVVRVPLTSPTKFNEVDNVELADTIAERLREDARVANFGDQWMLEERVPRFSRGDLRRLQGLHPGAGAAAYGRRARPGRARDSPGLSRFRPLAVRDQLPAVPRAPRVRFCRHAESAFLEHQQPAADRHHPPQAERDRHRLPVPAGETRRTGTPTGR